MKVCYYYVSGPMLAFSLRWLGQVAVTLLIVEAIMSIDVGLLEESRGPFPPSRALSPLRVSLVLVTLIFLAETVAMVALYYVNLSNYLAATLLDGLIMVALILPGLYVLQLKPLRNEMEERGQMEVALARSEDVMKRILELLPIGVGVLDEEGKLVHGNPALQALWGGMRYVEIEQYGEYKAWSVESGEPLQPDDWGGSRAIKRGESVLDEEIEIETFDGRRKTILNSAVPIQDEEGGIQGAIVVNRDITWIRQEEKAMIQANELLQRVFASIDTLIAYMDRDFNFVQVNETYARAGGHPPDFFVGKNHFDLYPHEENRAIFRRVVQSGEPFWVFEKPFEYPEFPERGLTYWNWSVQPVKDKEGQVEGVVLSLVDVSERKRAELLLERQNEQLRALIKAETRARSAAEMLSEAAQAFARTLELERVIQALLDYVQGIVGFDAGGVILLDDESGTLVRTQGAYRCRAEESVLPSCCMDERSRALVERVRRGRKSVTIPNESGSLTSTVAETCDSIESWLLVPIIADNELIGLLELGTGTTVTFSQEQIHWAETLAGGAAMAIQNARLFEQVRGSRERLQSLTRRLVEVQENERSHIARELHDDAAQALSSLKIGLGRLEQAADCPAEMRERLLALKGMADGVLEDLHRLAMDLRPIALDRFGLVAALEQYAKNVRSEQLAVQFKALGFEGERLPQEVETSIYRIVQEALTNVARHADAGNVGILLERSRDGVKVFIEDDGVGFVASEAKERHLGLIGMRERTEMLGGTLTIESAPGTGTTIIVGVPNVDSNSDCG